MLRLGEISIAIKLTGADPLAAKRGMFLIWGIPIRLSTVVQITLESDEGSWC